MKEMKLHKMTCFSISVFLIASGLGTINNISNIGSLGTRNILYVGGSGGGNYSTIQSAINAANTGDTIFVYSGTYYEHFIINKKIDLIGEDKNSTIIDGNGNDYIDVVVINSNADYTSIRNFTLSGGGLDSQDYAIDILAQYVILDNCIFVNNECRAICIQNHHCTVQNCTFIGDPLFTWFNINYITIQNCDFIYTQAKVIGSNLIFKNCNIDTSVFGLSIQQCYNSEIYGNTFMNCSSYGIEMRYGGGNNIFYHNNFINNANQILNDGNNYWYNTTLQEGNYWDDYTGIDSDGDGIGDTPYNIPGGLQDLYPLMEPWGQEPTLYDITIVENDIHTEFLDIDLSILSASAQPNENGYTLNVTVKNNAYCMAAQQCGWYSETGRSAWGEWDFYQESDEMVNISFRIGEDVPEPGATYRFELDGLYLGDMTIPATDTWYLVTVHNVTILQGDHTLFAGTYEMDYHPNYYIDYILIGNQRIEGEEYTRMGGNDPEPDWSGLYVCPGDVAVEFWQGDPYDSGILIGEIDIGKEQTVADSYHEYPEYTYITHYIENNGIYAGSYNWTPAVQNETYDVYVLLKSVVNMQHIHEEINLSNNVIHFLIDTNINPVAIWHFDEGTGDIIYDSSGNENHGMIYGADWSLGISGNALHFDGDDDYISVSHSSNLNITDDFTISSWVYLPTELSHSGNILGKESDPSFGYYLWIDADHKIHFGFNRGECEVESNTIIETNNWYHIVGVWDGENLMIYINGLLDVNSSFSGNPTQNINPLFIGYSSAPWSDSYYLKAILDEITIYDYAISQIDIWNQFLLYAQQPSIVYVDDDFYSSTPGWQYDHFDVIQDGIDAVKENGTVIVYNGIYQEYISIDKSISLIGENRDNTIIDGSNNKIHVVDVLVNFFNISNCTIRNSRRSSWSDSGLWFNSNNVSIINCNFYDNMVGIYGEGGSYSKVINCLSHDNGDMGVMLMFGSHNQIINSTAYNNPYKGFRIMGEQNLVKNCIAYNTWDGLLIDGCFNSTFVNNNLFDNRDGIDLWGGDYNILINNTVISNWEVGIWPRINSDYNLIYHNTVINNGNNAIDDGENNSWDNGYPSGGNYWGDYTGDDFYYGPLQDIPGPDGIGDEIYLISGGNNQDNYPLMEIWNGTPLPIPLPTTVYVDDDFDETIIGWQYDHFNVIQEGIDAVVEDATVFVYNGTYYENLQIMKSIELIGENTNTTIIDGRNLNDAIHIRSDKNIVCNFTIQNSSVGNPGQGYHNAGIQLKSAYCSNNLIKDCIISDNAGWGIFFNHSSINNTIKNCVIKENSEYGIFNWYANGINVFDCKIYNNSGRSIQFYWSQNHNIRNCNIHNGVAYGIGFSSVSNSTISNCNIYSNHYGIRFENSNNNHVYHNTFSNNNANAYDTGDNFWDNGYPSGGNYWDDYTGTDIDGDGIGDISYIISSGANQDFYPLGYFHPIANFTFSPEEPTHFDIIQFTDGSYDPDGAIVSWFWEFGDGNISTDQSPTHQYADDQIYHVNLTVTDDRSMTNKTSKIIIVGNVPPVANFTYEPLIPTDLDSIEFIDLSYDIDDIIMNWTWNFGDGTFSYLQNPVHQYDDDGVYIVNLTVRDDDNVNDSIEKSILISNVPPVSNFEYNPLNPTEIDTVQFLDLSNDADGILVNWTWDFDDGNVSYDQNPAHQFGDDGIYNIYLTVRDDDIATDIMTVQVIVSNVGPTPNFTYSPLNPTVENLIQFIDLSIDSSKSVVSWWWDFGDTYYSSAQNPTHQYAESGNYTVCLTIEDDDGATETYCKTIIISELDANQSTQNRGFPIRHAIDGDWGAAQSFIPTLETISSADVYLRKFGTPEFDLTVELRENHPQGTLIDTLTFTPAEVSESWGWFALDFEDTTITPSTQYFIVCPPPPSGVTTSYGYEWGYAFGNLYDDGAFWFTRNGGGLWRDLPTMYEFCFKTYGYN